MAVKIKFNFIKSKKLMLIIEAHNGDKPKHKKFDTVAIRYLP